MFRKRKPRGGGQTESTATKGQNTQQQQQQQQQQDVSETFPAASTSVPSVSELDLRVSKRPRGALRIESQREAKEAAEKRREDEKEEERRALQERERLHKLEEDEEGRRQESRKGDELDLVQRKANSLTASSSHFAETSGAGGSGTGAGRSNTGLRGMLAGPLRATAHVRTTNLMDYQPDVCKDFKDTGVCGFGDSCKFVHDRTDYKAGWQLEKDWDVDQKNKAQGIADEDLVIEREQGLPFACSVCRGPFVDPVKTRCGHYFCEDCILARQKQRSSGKSLCNVCGKDTGGAFTVCPPREVERLEQRRAEAEATGEVLPPE